MKRKVTIKADVNLNRIDNKAYGRLDYECQSCGYRLDSAVWMKDDMVKTKEYLNINLVPVAMYADIIKIDRFNPNNVKCMTTAYGYMSRDEYKDFADQATKTAYLLRVLEEFDFDKLPHMDEE